jgi:hypothetical protein
MSAKRDREPGVTITIEADGSMRRRVNVPKLERVTATPQIREALRRKRQEEAEMREKLEIIMREETKRLRVTRKGEEYDRIEHTRTTKIESFTSRTDRLVLSTDGHTREVRKVATTIAKLEKSGTLTRDLTIYLQQFAQRCAEGQGAATEDGDDSTSKLTSSYEPSGGAAFASKTPSDRQLSGLHWSQLMRMRIPRELMSVYDQIINEETAGWHDRARTLAAIGESIGYNHKQSSAAGGALVYAVCTLISHFVKENRLLVPHSQEKVSLEQQ